MNQAEIKKIEDAFGYTEEVGDQELTKEQIIALRQKFGLYAIQLTPSEEYLIQREDVKLGRSSK